MRQGLGSEFQEARCRVLVYLGVGFLLFGPFIVMVTATRGFNLTAFTALGGLVFAMGLILSFVALKTRDQAASTKQGP